MSITTSHILEASFTCMTRHRQCACLASIEGILCSSVGLTICNSSGIILIIAIIALIIVVIIIKIFTVVVVIVKIAMIVTRVIVSLLLIRSQLL